VIRLLSLVIALFALAAIPAARAGEDGFLMFGGVIYVSPVGGQANRPEALVVRGEKIVFTGSLAAARVKARGLPEIDLKGAAAYPGFVDSHVHLTGVGLREMTLNLDQVKSVAELVEAVRAWAAAHPGRGADRRPGLDRDPLAGGPFSQPRRPGRRLRHPDHRLPIERLRLPKAHRG